METATFCSHLLKLQKHIRGHLSKEEKQVLLMGGSHVRYTLESPGSFKAPCLGNALDQPSQSL